MYPEKFPIDQILNSRLSAIIYFIMPVKLCQIARPLHVLRKKLWFQGKMHPEKFKLDQIQNG